MLNLCMDVGNSRVALAVFQGEELLQRADIAIDNLEIDTLRWLVDKGYEPVKCAYSTVNPHAKGIIEQTLQALGIPAYKLDASTAPIEIIYDTPERLGGDRIANSMGAFARLQRACIVVDLGTATHFDIINDEGAFLGGPIAPGLYSSMRIFEDKLTHLSDFNLNEDITPVAQNTLDALSAGAMLFTMGGIEKTVKDISQVMGKDLPVIFTGGACQKIQNYIKSNGYYFPHLTLEGLCYYLKYLLIH